MCAGVIELLRTWVKLFVVGVVALCALPMTAPAEDLGDARLPIIRSIDVQVREIFDDSNLEWPYLLVNSLKSSTRESIIRRELLFEVGDELDEFIIQESERNLRSLPYVRQVTIFVALDGDYADVTVGLQDTWTLFPQVSFSSGGGSDKKALGVSDSNVLGYGKRLELLYADDEGRETIQTVYEDNRVLESYHRLLLGNFIRSDGFKSIASFGRPFRSLVERSAWVANGTVSNLVDKLYENGDERFLFRHKHLDFNIGFTRSTGDPEKLRRRYTLGYDYLKDTFAEADEGDFIDVDVDPNTVSRDPNMIPDDRRFSGPFFSFRQTHPEFVSLDYIDRFERVQDFNLGQEVFAKLGLAPEFLFSKKNTLFLQGSLSEGISLSPRTIIRGSISAGARYGDLGMANGLIRLEGKWYSTRGAQHISDVFVGRHTLAGSLQIDSAHELDKDKEFLLGASNGLRGYKNRTFTGDHRIVLNLEDRFHLVEELFKVMSIGGAFFFDAGGTSSKSTFDVLAEGLYADVGFGLRLAFPRAGSGSVVRFDVAFPLRNGPDGSDEFSPRFLITVGQVFGSGLSSEAPRVNQANVDVGF
jgi:hypothetical protein